jgi:peptidoglycan hydrolase-like protein with peptidoglycan-binding domain
MDDDIWMGYTDDDAIAWLTEGEAAPAPPRAALNAPTEAAEAARAALEVVPRLLDAFPLLIEALVRTTAPHAAGRPAGFEAAERALASGGATGTSASGTRAAPSESDPALLAFELGNTVGPPSLKGVVNRVEDVRALQERLIALGFNWLQANGEFDQETLRVVKLFQAIILGERTLEKLAPTGLVEIVDNPALTGLVGIGDSTYRWLQAVNAPRWQHMPQGGVAEGFLNVEFLEIEDFDYGTNWAAETIAGAGRAYKTYYDLRVATTPTALIMVNDTSPRRGGYAPPHAGHQTGLDFDLRLPRLKGGTTGGLTYKEKGIYDQATMRAMLTALNTQSLVDRIIFNDPDLAAEGLCQRDPVKPGKKPEDPREHDDHAHVDIIPPEMITNLPTGGADYRLGPAPTL